MQRSSAGWQTHERRRQGLDPSTHTERWGQGKSGKKPVEDNHPFGSREKLAMRGAGVGVQEPAVDSGNDICFTRRVAARSMQRTCIAQRMAAWMHLRREGIGGMLSGGPHHRRQFRGGSGLRPGGSCRCRLPAKSLHHAPASQHRRPAPAHTVQRRHPTWDGKSRQSAILVHSATGASRQVRHARGSGKTGGIPLCCRVFRLDLLFAVLTPLVSPQSALLLLAISG